MPGVNSLSRFQSITQELNGFEHIDPESFLFLKVLRNEKEVGGAIIIFYSFLD